MIGQQERIAGSRMAATILVRRLLGVSLYRNSAFLILNAAVPALTGFAFWTLTARLYSAGDIGVASAIISAMTLLMFLATFGMDYGLVRFLPVAAERSAELISTAFVVCGAAAVLFGGIFIAGIDSWAPSLIVLRDDVLLGGVFIIATAAFSIYSLAHHVFVARRRAGYALIQTSVFSIVRFMPLVALAGVWASRGIFTAWGVALVAGLAIGAAFLLPRPGIFGPGKAAFRPSVLGQMLRFSLANSVANLFWMSPGLLLPLMVISLAGAQANAHFAIGWAVAGIILMVPMGVSMALFAEGSNDERRLRDDLVRSACVATLLVCAALVLIWFAGDGLLRLFGAEYADHASRLLRLLSMAALPASVNYLYMSVCRVRKRMGGAILLSGSIAVLTLALAFFFLPLRGIEGVGFSYLIAQTVPFPVVSILLVKYTADHTPREPEFGDFVDGAMVSQADLDLHVGRYRFGAEFVRGRNVLDIGCGTGYGSAHLRSQGAASVVGGDISANAVALARRQEEADGALSFRQLDATDLPFPDGSFGVATAFEIIEHVRSYDRLLSEAYRVLEPGGLLVLSTPNRKAGPLFFSTSWDYHVHEFMPRELCNLVAGRFGVCEMYGQDFISVGQLVQRRLRQTAGRLLEKLGLRSLEMWLGRVLYRHNRRTVFHTADFADAGRAGDVTAPIPGLIPTSLVLVARKR